MEEGSCQPLIVSLDDERFCIWDEKNGDWIPKKPLLGRKGKIKSERIEEQISIVLLKTCWCGSKLFGFVVDKRVNNNIQQLSLEKFNSDHKSCGKKNKSMVPDNIIYNIQEDEHEGG